MMCLLDFVCHQQTVDETRKSNVALGLRYDSP